MAPVNTENTPGNDVSFRWRQNIINVKVFLTVVGNDQREPPGTPRAWPQGEEEKEEEEQEEEGAQGRG